MFKDMLQIFIKYFLMKKTPTVEQNKNNAEPKNWPQKKKKNKLPQYRTTPTSTLIQNYFGKTWHITVSSR